MSQAPGESMQKLSANRKTLIHRPPEQARRARTVEIGQFDPPMNLLWMETVLLFDVENAQSQGILYVQGHSHFMTITSRSGQRQKSKYLNLQEH